MVCGEKEMLAVEKSKLLIPPLWNTFFSWGTNDNSESLADWGECLCAACPNPNTIITGGTSSVVCVWEICIGKDKLKHMRLKQALYGHTDAVTCLVASEAYSVIVSGSWDRSCILWDLEELSYITQLPGHAASLTALAINDLTVSSLPPPPHSYPPPHTGTPIRRRAALRPASPGQSTHWRLTDLHFIPTGEIASCAGAHLYLWTMKGQLLSCIDTTFGPEGEILCCCFTQKYEWDPRNVIVTGCADGIVRIWKTEYTRAQLPSHQAGPDSPGSPQSGVPEKADAAGKEWERHLVLSQELNRSQTVSRRRYKNNPAVTALAISRTHGSLLVGDAWGRVFSWTCEG
ncbi:hypothetical protein JZ751_019857 [Albula glossodonta]|uniref:Uncharacterized protein n=1 Tax=Albula glossodonta TaxID=121402 RepID=A0A8T2NK58_9TELE|nr:hypothetical protein JZ751_019857 [Albula glossodonta]